MTSARRLYRFNLTLAGLGALGVVLVAVAATSRIDISLGSAAEIAAACRRMLVPGMTAGSALVLAVAALVAAVVVRGVRSVTRELRAQWRFVRPLAARAFTGVAAGREVQLFEDRVPAAFSAGLLRPRVYLSSAAVDALSAEELEAVVVHEAHHCARRDPLRLLLARFLADALFFVPVLRRASERYAALAEIAADEAAVRESGEQSLASALLVFGGAERAAPVVGIAPERVDHLLGTPPSWQLAPGLVALSTVAALVLAALAIALASAPGPITVEFSTLLAEGCMVAMAAVPLLLTLGAVVVSRRLTPRRPA